MGKTMARIQNGVVVNLEFYDDNVNETDKLKNVGELLIEIDDTYADGKFYRNGVEVLTFRNRLKNMLSNYDTALTELASYVSAPVALSEDDTEPTLEERKQAILIRLNDMLSALDTLEVTPSE